MKGRVTMTVFPRLECCVPDFTGKNAELARLLQAVKKNLADRIVLEVVPAAEPHQRIGYHLRLVDALAAGGHELPFVQAGGRWAALRRQIAALQTGAEPDPADIGFLRQWAVRLFMVPPVIALNGKAVFISEVPALSELADAVARAAELELKEGEVHG